MGAWVTKGLALLALVTASSIAVPAAAEYLVPEAGIRFPDRLGPLSLWKGERFPEAALGHGIEYRARAPGFDRPVFMAGSIYVYNGGLAAIPNGIDSQVVRAEFAKARGDIATVARRNKLPEPELVGERTLKVSGIELLGATYRMVRGDTPVISFLGLTGARQHFIKLRVSVPTAGGATGTDVIDSLVADVCRLLAASAGLIHAPSPVAAGPDAAALAPPGAPRAARAGTPALR